MKRTIALLCGACVVVVSTAIAEAGESGPFIKLELGPTLVEDVQITELLGTPAGQTIEFDPGFRFAVGGGYSFFDFLAIGGETGVSYNTIDRISGGVDEGESGIGNIPLLANIVFKLPNKTGLVPFVGAGAGISYTFLNVDDFDAPGLTDLEGSESDAVFAWQLFGGLKYELNDRMAFGLVYKYLHTDKPRWEAEDQAGFESDLSIEEMNTHAVMFNFTFRF